MYSSKVTIEMREFENGSNLAQDMPPPLPVEQSRGPFGFWATLGIAAGIFLTMSIFQVVALIPFALIEGRTAEIDPESLENNGLFLGLATVIGAPILIGLTFLTVFLRKGPRWKAYLGFERCSWISGTVWTIIGIVAIVVVGYSLERLAVIPEVSEFALQAYQTAGSIVLLWIAIVVTAPVIEELLFRGFVYKGFVHSAVGVWGAILIPSLIWTLIHMQYGFGELLYIFLLGIVLGLARWKTGSVVVPMIIHLINNAWSMISVAQELSH